MSKSIMYHVSQLFEKCTTWRSANVSGMVMGVGNSLIN